MNQQRIKLEYVLYALAFLLALGVRLAGANQMPLTNAEADLALQALALARGQAALIGPHPAYLALTTLLMYVFGATNLAARFWPVLLGSLLVLLPMLFRARLGRTPALLLAFFLAFDPGLLAVSRQADSLSLAVFFTLLTFGLWLNRRPVLTGVAGGLALLCGPQVWPGLAGLALAGWAASALRRRSQGAAMIFPSDTESLHPDGLDPSAGVDWRQGLLSGLVTLCLAATLFFTIPNGLSALGESIPAYLRGWVDPGGMPVSFVMLALLLYEFLPLIFGLWGGIRALWLKSPSFSVDRFLLIWWALALILLLAYPGRQPGGLVWSILPLWGLGARQAARLVRVPVYDRLPVLGQMLLAAIIITFNSMALVSMTNAATADMTQYILRMVGALIMLVASTALIAWGWSRAVALRGLAWGAGVVLFLYSLSIGWNAVGLSGHSSAELWAGEPRVKDASLFTLTFQNLSQWGPQQSGGLEVVVVDVPSPALRWLLRDVSKVSYVGQLPSSTSPAVVITQQKPELALAATYRGEAFVLGEGVDWSKFGPADWFRWLALRIPATNSLQQNKIIFWARTDLFPGGTLQQSNTSDTSQQAQPGSENQR